MREFDTSDVTPAIAYTRDSKTPPRTVPVRTKLSAKGNR